MSEMKIKVVVVMDGGVVQNILTDSANVQVVLVDYDAESYERQILSEVKQGNGGTASAYVAKQSPEVDADETERMFRYAEDWGN